MSRMRQGGLQIIDISNPAAPQLIGSFINPGTTTIAKGIAVAGNYAYLAYGDDGLIIVDVSTPASLVKVGAYDTPSLSNSIFVKDDYAFIAGHDTGLLIINIANPANPSLTGSYNTAGLAAGIYVNGQYAYVADLASGLQVVNIANPASPSLAFNVPTSGNAVGVYGKGGYAYMGASEAGLQIIQVTCPWISLTSPNGGEIWTAGTIQHIFWGFSNASGTCSLDLFKDDVLLQNIATLVNIGDMDYGFSIPSNLPNGNYRVRVRQDALEDFSDNIFTIGNSSTSSITLTSPNGGENWLVGSTYPITWLYTGSIENVRLEYSINGGDNYMEIVDSTTISGTYDWIIPDNVSSQCLVRINDAADAGINDVSNSFFTISAPPVGTIALTSPDGGESWRSGSMHAITWTSLGLTGNVTIDLQRNGVFSRRIADAAAVSANSYNWLLPTDLSGGGNYQVRVYQGSVEDSSNSDFSVTYENGSLGICDTTNARDVHVVGDRAYVADWDGGLRIINVAYPAAPAVVGTFKSANATAYAKSVRVAGGYAYIAYGEDGLVVVNISNPASPQLAGSYNTPGSSRSVQIVGNTAYVADETGGLQIIDISNPAAPQLIGSFINPGTTTIAKGIAVAGNYAYLAYGDDGLIIVDVSTPASLVKVGAYDTPSLSNSIFVKDDYAYIAGHDTGLLIINIANPANPSLTGSYNTAGLAAGIYVNGQFAYVADLASGLQVVDIANPASPSLAFNVPTSGNAVGVYGKGGYAYMGASEAGLQIVQVTCPWIAISAPNAGENWQMGTSYDIVWNLNNATGNVNIELYRGDVWYRSIATVDSALEKHEWTIPGDISASNNYRIRLVQNSSGYLEDLSDNIFAIQAAGSSFVHLPGNSFLNEASLDRMNQIPVQSLQNAGTRWDRSMKDESGMQLIDDWSDHALSGPHADNRVNTPVISQIAVYGTTYYIHSFDGKLLAEYDANGICQKDYVYMGNKLIAEYQPAVAKTYYYTSDQINSTRMITDSSGSVVYSAMFDPYGGMQKKWVNTYQPSLKFSGKERESKSELDYFGARYYDHLRYRFISVDPMINKEEALANPQLWNLYAYCRNNPITFFDPDGRNEILIWETVLTSFAKVLPYILAACDVYNQAGGPITEFTKTERGAWVYADGSHELFPSTGWMENSTIMPDPKREGVIASVHNHPDNITDPKPSPKDRIAVNTTKSHLGKPMLTVSNKGVFAYDILRTPSQKRTYQAVREKEFRQMNQLFKEMAK